MTKYIALLRGINISGKNKISMAELKSEFEKLEYKNVLTYLNSGNVIFESNITTKEIIKEKIEKSILEKFNLDISTFIITKDELEELLKNSPNWWGLDNKETYDNIIFVIPPTSYNEVYSTLGEPKVDLEKIQEYKNNIFWSYNLKNYRKTNWWSKTASTSVTNKITVRTANTMKKVFELCNR